MAALGDRCDVGVSVGQRVLKSQYKSVSRCSNHSNVLQEVLLEGIAQAVGQTGGVIDDAAALFAGALYRCSKGGRALRAGLR